MPDEEGCAAGEPRASGGTPGNGLWLELYETHYEQVRRFFARRVENLHDVEDLVQTVFTNLIGHKGTMSYPDIYLRAIARHELLRYWRRERRFVRIGRVLSECDDDPVAELACRDSYSNPLERLLREETAHTVESMVAGLTPALAEALKLRFFYGLAVDEAAARAGCSREALKKRLKRARRSIIELHS